MVFWVYVTVDAVTLFWPKDLPLCKRALDFKRLEQGQVLFWLGPYNCLKIYLSWFLQRELLLVLQVPHSNTFFASWPSL